MFPSPRSHSGGGTKRKRQGVGFSSTSRDPLGLPSIPRLPPDSQHVGPAVHIDVDPNAPSSRRYPSASELHGKTMRLNPVLFASGKWFSVIGACAFDDIAHSYADGAGMLPGQIPLQAIRSYDWLACIAIPLSILCHTRPCGRAVLSTRFMTAVCDRLELPLTQDLVPEEFGCDTWQFRTDGERSYLDNMLAWTSDDPLREANRLWFNQRTVSGDAMLWTNAIIPANFRHIKRGSIPFFQHNVRFERLMRSDTGYFVAYQMLEAREISRSHYANRYQRIPS